MSRQRYTPEFKDEDVKQVVDLGYTVAEVAELLGVPLKHGEVHSIERTFRPEWIARKTNLNRD